MKFSYRRIARVHRVVDNDVVRCNQQILRASRYPATVHSHVIETIMHRSVLHRFRKLKAPELPYLNYNRVSLTNGPDDQCDTILDNSYCLLALKSLGIARIISSNRVLASLSSPKI